jgi:hypothetical protein
MGDSAGMVNRDEVIGLRRQARTYAAIAITAVALAIGAGLAYFFATASSGDEPPIRVKGGSLDLDVIAQKQGNGWMLHEGTWIAKNGKRNGSKLAVMTLPPSDDNNCEKWLYLANDDITITFTDTAGVSPQTFDVTFNVKDHTNPAGEKERKTSINPGTLPLTLSSTDVRKLANSDDGYISSIKIGKNLTCSFAREDKEEVVVFER